MASIPVKQTRFSGGEISPLLYGDTSRPSYGISVRRCLNWIPIAQGPLVARPGTKYIGSTQGNATARLIPFIATDGNNYLLEFTNLLMRVYLNGVLQTGGTNPVTTPWTSAMLPYLKYSQVGNVMTICYGGQAAGVAGLAPRDLTYTSATNWALGTTNTDTRNVGSWTTLPNSRIGTAKTLAYDAAHTYHAGERSYQGNYSWTALQDGFSGQAPPADPTTSSLYWTPTIDSAHPGAGTSGTFYVMTAVLQRTADGIVYETGPSPIMGVLGANGGYDAPPTFDRPVWVYGCAYAPPAGTIVLYFRFYKGPSLASPLTGWVADMQAAENTANLPLTDPGIAPDFGQQPPTSNSDFQQLESPFAYGNLSSPSYSYPAVVTHYDQRRLFARSSILPQSLWGSKVGNLYRFDRPIPGNDADAVLFTLASEQLEEIRSIVPVRVGLLMTYRGEWTLRGSQAAGFSRSNVDLKRQSQWGSSWLDPISIGTGILFNTAKSNMVRDLYPLYGLYTDIWDGDDLSQQARHLMDGHMISSWAYQSTPYSVVWAARDDGALLSLTYYRQSRGSIAENAPPTVAWAQHYTGQGDLDAPLFDPTTTYSAGALSRYNALTWQSTQDQNQGNAPIPNSAFWLPVAQDGFVEAVCAVPEPPEDAVYLVVRRVINGVTVRYIERLANVLPPSDVRQSWFLDCATQFDGRNVNSSGVYVQGVKIQLSGGTYLAGTQAVVTNITNNGVFLPGDAGASAVVLDPDVEQASGSLGVVCRIVAYTSATVATVEFDVNLTAAQIAKFVTAPSAEWGLAKSVYNVPQITNCPVDSALAGGARGVAALADGSVAPGITVVGSTVTLLQPSLIVQIGLSYNCDVQLLDAFHPQAEIRNRFKSVMVAGFHVATTRGIWAGRDFAFANLYEWEQQTVGGSWGALQPGTGYFETEVSDDWNKDGGLAFRHFEPLPATLLGALRKIEMGGT